MTLVELLMVFSIIAILSSVIYAAMEKSRAKARNAYTVTTFEQWSNFGHSNGTL